MILKAMAIHYGSHDMASPTTEITHNGAKTLSVEGQYGIEEGKPANFLLLDADSPFEAVRQRADILASIRSGEYLFKRPNPSYNIALDLFRKAK